MVADNGACRQQEARHALRFRFANCPDDALIVVSTWDGKEFRNQPYRITELDDIARRYAGHEDAPDVWTRVSVLHKDVVLKPGSRGTKSQTYGVSTLWVDIDPDGTDDFRDRTLRELQQFDPPPSVIEDSGRGYYALWKIPFTTDRSRVERINKWLALQLGGDHCFNADRILRLPGTLNHKPDCKRYAQVVESHPDREYALDAFGEADLKSSETSKGDYEPEALPIDFEARVIASSHRLWARILSESSALEAGAPVRQDGHVDRSRNDFYIACALKRLGQTEGQVFSVLTHPTWFSGEKFRQRHSERYVNQTIAEAFAVTPDVEIKKPAPLGKWLLEQFHLAYHLGFWYRYDAERGVYVEAEQALQFAIQACAGDSWNRGLQDNVFAYLRPHAELQDQGQFDLVNVENGMLDWRTGELQPHAPGYGSLMQVPAVWDADADCTEVDAFVSNLPEDAIPIWWMFCGYCLYTRTPLPHRSLLAIVGRMRTGKSTLLNALAYFLGVENVSAVTLSNLTDSGTRFATSELVGKMLNVDLDSPYEVRVKENHVLKKLAVGEPVQVERKYHDAYTARLPVKLAFAMNEVPSFGVAEEALYNRWIVLSTRADLEPFRPGDGAHKLNAHLALLSQPHNRNAWLKRSVEGLRQLWASGGFPETGAVTRGRDTMRFESDNVYRFWLTCTSVAQDEAEARTELLVRFYQCYKDWVLEGGGHPVGVKRFRSRSEELGTEGLVPGLALRHNGTQWMVVGRVSTWGLQVVI